MAKTDTTIDWHIKCSKNMKSCVLYEDEEEKFPAANIMAHDGYIEIERTNSISPLLIEGEGGKKLTDFKVELSI